MTTTYALDLKRLFDALGGPTQVAYVLGKMGLPLAARTPHKWLHRASIDGLYLANLLAHEALMGRPLDLNQFIVPVAPGEVRRPRPSRAGLAASVRSMPRKGAEC